MPILDQMNQIPDILMPPLVYNALGLSVTSGDFFLPDEVIRNRKDDPRFYVYDSCRLEEVAAVVDEALQDVKTDTGNLVGLRTDALEFFSNVLEGMRTGLETIRANQAARTQ